LRPVFLGHDAVRKDASDQRQTYRDNVSLHDFSPGNSVNYGLTFLTTVLINRI